LFFSIALISITIPHGLPQALSHGWVVTRPYIQICYNWPLHNSH
jgi:hypothetical protein